MTVAAGTLPQRSGLGDQALVQAVRLAAADNALGKLASGQIDAVVDPSGNTFLLRAAQEELRRNEQRLQAVFDTVPDVITVLDGDGVVRYQNPAVTRMLGYPSGNLVGRKMADYVHPDHRPRFDRSLREALQQMRPVTTVEFDHRTLAGAWCRLEAMLGLLQPSEGAGVILTFRDATHWQLDQEQSAIRERASAQAAQAKDRFLAILSHELRTPLMPALLGIDELQSDERFAEARPTLTMIRRNIQLQSRLLEELMDFIALGEHKVRLKPETVDMHEAVHFVLKICGDDIAAARMRVNLDLAAHDILIRADPARLQQVMWNLLKNAIKFSEPGGSVSIASANDTPGILTLTFADQGIGIEPELLPLVFEPFQQGDQASQRMHGGLGLGMYIARSLTEALQGTLMATSKGRGLGAAFFLSFQTQPVRGNP